MDLSSIQKRISRTMCDLCICTTIAMGMVSLLMLSTSFFVPSLLILIVGLFAAGLSLGFKRASRLSAEINQAKTTFVANLSHEIRGPIGVMMGFADLITDPTCSEDDRVQYIKIMKRNGQSLLTIIDDILDLSKVEAGKLKIQFGNVDLYALIKEVSTIFEPRALAKGLSLKVNVAPEVPKLIVTDSVRLRQILTNVIGNAIKFTSQGWVGLEVKLLPSNENFFRIGFEIRDTGPGMTSNEVAKIFHPFTQCESTQSSQFGGAGLGLALSRRLAQALSGNIEVVESRPHQGSVFLITLNVQSPSQNQEKTFRGQMANHPTAS